MQIRRPSPAMAVACTALFVSLGGTGIAAVNYAANAGKVDGKDARSASSPRASVAGDLVATASSGPDRGRIPGKFLADVARTQAFGRSFEVADNAVAVPATFAADHAFGTLTATCADEDARPGVEDPVSTITLANSSPTGLNVSQRAGRGNAVVTNQAAGTQQSLSVKGSNTFEWHIQSPTGSHWLVQGIVRQDGAGSPAASCLVYGTALRVAP